MGLPLSDPQFWFVTLLVALVALAAARRVRRSLDADAESPCANCPKVAPGASARSDIRHGDRKSRLRVVSLAALALLPAASGAASVERTVAAMGTTLTVAVEVATDRAAALALAESMIREVEATEARLSTWRGTSELSALNRTPVGEWREVSSELYGEVRRAQQCAIETGDAFDPTVGALVEAWGLRTGGRQPSQEELAAARARTGWRGIEFHAGPERLRRTVDLRVEEGGFGKGVALDRAVGVARRAAPGTAVQIDLGGQLAWSGQRGPRRIRLADPRDRARPVVELELELAAGSIATSGDSERSVDTGGTRVGHLLDPRTGEPAVDFGSVTVVAADATGADCLSTALFVHGPRAGLALIESSPWEIEAVFLVVEGRGLVARVSRGLADRVRPLVDGLIVEVDRAAS